MQSIFFFPLPPTKKPISEMFDKNLQKIRVKTSSTKKNTHVYHTHTI